jgi:pimeloyl-ACP methyl ester carboxylesterase
MMDTTQITVGSFTFDALADGPEDGEVVLLLHGFPQTSRSWRDQIAALSSAGYRAVAPDQRGYSPGARPSTVDDYALPELVGDVVGIADALGTDRFHLVGHDWGGAVAWHVAGRHPERLRTLTVVSTPHPKALFRAYRGELGGDQAQRSSYIAAFREPDSQDRFLENDAAVFRLLFDASGMPAGRADPYIAALGTPEALGAALNWYRAAAVEDAEGLGPITVPTLYVWSTDDIALSREAAEATAEFVAGPYSVAVLEGVSHWVAEQAPGRLNELLLDHLSSCSSSKGSTGGDESPPGVNQRKGDVPC